MNDNSVQPKLIHSTLLRTAFIALGVFLLLGVIQLVQFQLSPVEDYYQPQGYIERVNTLIRDGKLQYQLEKTREGYRPSIRTAELAPEEMAFYEQSWLRDDLQAFNDGNSDVFLIDKGKLQGVNIYRHRVESPLASDWKWWGRIYSESAEGYAYLWNSRRTLKLYRPPAVNRTNEFGSARYTARVGQSEFREVIYGRGHLFQTGLGITLKGRSGNRLVDVYSLAENIVMKSYSNSVCFVNGHPLPRGIEQRLEEGDLVQVHFDKTAREEFLFHDFSRKPLSFVNVVNGRANRTNLDTSFHLIDSLADGIESAVRITKKEKKAEFDIHLALEEDISGLTQTTLENYGKQISRGGIRASCTIMDALTGNVLAAASLTKKQDDINENLRLHPVGSATKIFLAAAATQSYPELVDVQIDPHAPGDEKTLLGYSLKEGYKLRAHAPYPGDSETVDFANYIAKSCNRYHAILMGLSLARDHASTTGSQQPVVLTDEPLDTTNGRIYFQDQSIDYRPDLSYFIEAGPGGSLECRNLENSEIGLNMERLFEIKRKYVEGSSEFFSKEPWNILFARLGIEQSPEIYPAFYPVMPQSVNLGLNLNIDFRQDFISILFGGSTNRWNNIKLAEATSRLVTGKKVQAHFVNKISERGTTLEEKIETPVLELNRRVQRELLNGMAGVNYPGGTAADIYQLLEEFRSRSPEKYMMEFYGKTGTPFRREIRKGEQELYSSVFLFTAVLRNRDNGEIRDALTFAIYIEDQGEHKAVDFMKQLLGRVLTARRWI